MSGVELATLPIGVLWFTQQNGSLAPAAGASAYLYAHGTQTQIQVYGDEALTVPLTQPLTADTKGTLPGYIDAGSGSPHFGTVFDIAATYSGVSLPTMMGNAIRGDGVVTVVGTLAGDTDVAIATPANGQVLVYDGSSGKWTNRGGFASTIENVNAVATSGATQTIPDVTTDTMNRIVLSANCTLTFPAAAAGKSFLLALVQDATGTRTVTWPGSVKWAAGTAPTLTTTANKSDLFSFICLDGANWLGVVAGENF